MHAYDIWNWCRRKRSKLWMCALDEYTHVHSPLPLHIISESAFGTITLREARSENSACYVSTCFFILFLAVSLLTVFIAKFDRTYNIHWIQQQLHRGKKKISSDFVCLTENVIRSIFHVSDSSDFTSFRKWSSELRVSRMTLEKIKMVFPMTDCLRLTNALMRCDPTKTCLEGRHSSIYMDFVVFDSIPPDDVIHFVRSHVLILNNSWNCSTTQFEVQFKSIQWVWGKMNYIESKRYLTKFKDAIFNIIAQHNKMIVSHQFSRCGLYASEWFI